MRERLIRLGAKRLIARRDGDPWDSGVLACQIAHRMGFSPIIACGFDRWATGRRPKRPIEPVPDYVVRL